MSQLASAFSLLTTLLVTGAALAYPGPLNETDQGSRPKPGPYDEIWHRFYNAGSEGAITPALVSGGQKMVPHICRAIRDSRMHCRRYAIGALGHLRDRRAIHALETIYADPDEDSLFRGDALEAIFVIDQELGRHYAARVLARNLTKDDYLRSTAERIFEHPESLLVLPSES